MNLHEKIKRLTFFLTWDPQKWSKTKMLKFHTNETKVLDLLNYCKNSKKNDYKW